MKRHFAFPPLDDIETWKNEYTGTVYQANDGQEASKQKKQISNSKEGIDRRNAFFEGKTRNVKQDRSEINEQEAERLPTLDSRSSMLNNAKTYIGKSFHESETDNAPKEEKPLSFSRSFQFQKPNKASSEKILAKDSLDTKQATESKSVKFRTHETVPEREKKMPENILVAQNNILDSVQKFDVKNNLYGKEVHDFLAFSNYNEENEVLDLMMDILNDNRGIEQSELATELVDYAKQLQKHEYQQQLERKQILGQMIQSSVDSIQVKSKEDSIVNDVSVQRIATDVQALLQKSKSMEWKSDPVVQERAGIWALHVAAKRAGLSTKNISSSFKKNSLQAFGRLALQVLSNSKAEQKNDLLLKDDSSKQETIKGITSNINRPGGIHMGSYKEKQQTLESHKTIGNQMFTKSVVALKVDAENLLREESTIQDLQLLQNGIQEDTSADEILDAFIETLRNDELDVDAADSRMDIFSGSKFASTIHDYETKFKPDYENKKINRQDFTEKTETRSASSKHISFREDIQQSIQAPKTEISEKAKSFTVKFKDDIQDEFRSQIVQNVSAGQESKDSKFSEIYIE